MDCTVKFDINNLHESYEINKLAKQANGSVVLREKNAVILANVVLDNKAVEEDFLPLIVQYIERSYSAGKIPGGFVKREQKPGEFETLTSRIIDRSLRPLFPKGFKNTTQITVMVLSVDKNVDLQVLALNAAAAALYVSDIPIKKSVCGVRVGKIDDELVINPSLNELRDSSLDMFVSGTKDEVLMIEMKTNATKTQTPAIASADDILVEPAVNELISGQNMNELTDEDLVETLQFAQSAISEATKAYEENFPVPEQLADVIIVDKDVNSDIFAYIDELKKADVEDAVAKMAKSERAVELENIAKEVSTSEVAEKEGWSYEEILKVVEKYKRGIVRDLIINKNIRADGRALNEVRPIAIETNILPSVHGSCLFTRGQTQVLATVTLGGDQDAQMYDLLTEKGALSDKLMIHYNFHSFCVGESKPLGPPSRRELGHGNLAKRAIEPSLDLDFDNTVRIVAEVLESNGSSSMATICSGSLALESAGIETHKMVAGVAMGLVIEDDKHAVLSDILGLEDHDGDMDFKVAGTKDGITALQMDIKLGGISTELLREALAQAKEARVHILDLMEDAKEKIVINSKILPSTQKFLIHPSKIVEVIGQAGKTIKEIIERFGVSVDLNRDNGQVKVAGSDKSKVDAACEHIKTITKGSPDREREEAFNFEKVYKVDEVLTGTIRRIVDFGAFVELPKGGEGLLHISKISKERIGNIRDVLKEEQEIEVKILSVRRNRAELGIDKI